VLLCEPAATRLEPLIAALLLEPGDEVRRFWASAGLSALTLKELLDA
jgi:hypothetical protein